MVEAASVGPLRTLRRAAQAGIVEAVRLASSPRRRALTPGAVTVVIVNWGSLEFLRVGLRAVRRFSPRSVRIRVVDNASRDGSRPYLRGRRDVDVTRLPVNVGHGTALDIGFLLAQTEFAVALDVDAFPIRADWLDVLLDPLRRGAVVSGGRSPMDREWVHPSCLAMRVEDFAVRRHTFRANYVPGPELGRTAWDTAERISMRERGRLHLLDPSEVRGPGPIGTVFAGVVYHNFYATRPRAARSSVLDGIVRVEDVRAAWREATERFLGVGGGAG